MRKQLLGIFSRTLKLKIFRTNCTDVKAGQSLVLRYALNCGALSKYVQKRKTVEVDRIRHERKEAVKGATQLNPKSR